MLTYRGVKHPFQLSGLSAGDVVVSEAAATGAAYHLKRLKDFSGTYVAADAGVTVGGGMGITAMRNEKGVAIQLNSISRRVQFMRGASGVKIDLGGSTTQKQQRR